QPVLTEDRPPAKLEQDRCAVGGRNQPADVRQHLPVASPAGSVRPDDVAVDSARRGPAALAVADALVAAVRAHECVSGRSDSRTLLVAPAEDGQEFELHAGDGIRPSIRNQYASLAVSGLPVCRSRVIAILLSISVSASGCLGGSSPPPGSQGSNPPRGAVQRQPQGRVLPTGT